jgi:hypothetical protein
MTRLGERTAARSGDAAVSRKREGGARWDGWLGRAGLAWPGQLGQEAFGPKAVKKGKNIFLFSYF